jgi:hypothetical protein
MADGMSHCSLDFDFFEHCVYGKKNRVRFPSSATREEGIYSYCTMMCLDPCQFHHWENMCTMSLFIEYFSMNTWIYFPRNKSEVFDMFK